MRKGWEIEIFFRVLKQGCRVEELRLETDRRLSNWIGIYLIVAWRIHVITMQSREWPDIRCDILFSEKEWKTIYLMHKKGKPPKEAVCATINVEELIMTRAQAAGAGSGRIMFMIH